MREEIRTDHCWIKLTENEKVDVYVSDNGIDFNFMQKCTTTNILISLAKKYKYSKDATYAIAMCEILLYTQVNKE